ncbi:DNA ligase [Shewanella sp. UCD-KL21]|uniref:DNA ligase n=1 Tax=Shewanella sp. UCD-KL21 TaxID=1917164 RepID=UPI0009F88FB4|nr:DNA ligase [Shewanella sp. UCD-KL21]
MSIFISKTLATPVTAQSLIVSLLAYFIRRNISIIITVLSLFAAPILFAADKPSIQLATKITKGIDIKQYYVSEKLDGVRGYWTGKKMLSRSGREMVLPQWFVADFPEQILEGELWLGRASFEAMSGLARKNIPDSEMWRQVKFMLFDLPEHGGMFRDRYIALQQLAKQSQYLQVIPQETITSDTMLYQKLDSVVSAQGEGLMLHRQQAFYKVGRSQDIMKLKPKYDAEAIVIEHIEGKGKYTGMLGAIVVSMPDGREFKIGSGFSDEQRRKPPKIGATITYQYLGLTKNGVPRFAHFLRERPKM